MEVLFDGAVGIAYSQAYVTSDEAWESDLNASFVGQTVGLCGAAQSGYLWLVTGTQNGDVHMRVELHDVEPPHDHSWADVVEVSFQPISDRVNLTEWAGEVEHRLALPMRPYRVRYCASYMDAGDGSDRYALLFWPGARKPDAVLKESSESARYWNRTMGGQRPAAGTAR